MPSESNVGKESMLKWIKENTRELINIEMKWVNFLLSALSKIPRK